MNTEPGNPAREWTRAARILIAQASEEHPTCCDWCLVCTRCDTACLPARMTVALADILHITDTDRTDRTR